MLQIDSTKTGYRYRYRDRYRKLELDRIVALANWLGGRCYCLEEVPASYEFYEIAIDTDTDSDTEVYTNRDPHTNVK